MDFIDFEFGGDGVDFDNIDYAHPYIDLNNFELGRMLSEANFEINDVIDELHDVTDLIDDIIFELTGDFTYSKI